jgi:hypothetical protein
MRARALLLALILLGAFAGTHVASGGIGLTDLADTPASSNVSGQEFLSPMGLEKGGQAFGQGAGNATAEVEVGLPARVVDFTPSVPTATRTFATTDFTDPEAGPRQGTTDWRVVGGTGNAAELWFHITNTGRILDLGGRYINFSDDQGVTWKSVKPSEELVNAEGSVLQAPNGDVVAVTWDPYSGDRVLTFKYVAAESKWYYTYQPLHNPFWDRPEINVVPGNFNTPLGNVPYITFLHGFPQAHWQYSTDGLNYPHLSHPTVDARNGAAAIQSWLDVTPNPMLDYMQPNVDGLFDSFTSLGNGNALKGSVMFTGQDMKWHPWTMPNGESLSGATQVDSRGWLHNLSSGDYSISTDGGRTWNVLENLEGRLGDFKANGAAGVAAVVAERNGPKGVQDFLYKIDISTPEPKLMRTYLVGDGDDGRISGAGAYTLQGGHRFDFSNVAIFPDGRLAVTFMDKKTRIPVPTLGENPVACAVEDQPDGPMELGSPCRVVAPMLAIEQETRLPAR